MLHKLTPRVILGAKPLDQPYEIRDTELKGLLLRVQPSGVKSYVLELGRARRRTIGRDPVVTLAQARITARQWVADRDSGKLPPAARGKSRPLTLGEFVEKHYEPWIVADHKAGKATVAALAAQFKERYYKKRLDEITAFQVEKFKADRLKAGISRSTVNRDLDRIRAVLSRAVEWGKLDAHPLRTVKRLKGADENRVRFLDADEERRLRTALVDRENVRRKRRIAGNEWAAIRGYTGRRVWGKDEFTDHLMPMVLLALNTGLRRGELFGLTWADVDVCNKILTVRASTSKAQRTRRVPLNTEALDALKRWKRDATEGLVFPGAAGSMTNINRSWKALCVDAELDDFRFHDCRHHFASKLVMAGVDLYTVKELLGHRDFTTTQRYAHLAPEHQAAAVEVLTQKSRSARHATR